MNSLNSFVRQCRRNAVTGGMLMAVGVLSVAPALTAMAGVVTNRSVQMSSSVASAINVDYNVKFTAATNGTGAFVLDFCTDSAVGTACTPPTGLDVGDTPTTTGSDTVTAVDENTVRVVLNTAVNNGQEADVDLGGLTNPSTPNETIYARIVTYTDSTASNSYVDAQNLGTYLDEGSVALPITQGTQVGGTVLESLSFCVSGEVLQAQGCEGTLSAPNVVLGPGGILGTTASTGVIYSGISTNADGGAVVNLKSDAEGCGGLIRAGAPTACDITPITQADVTTFPNDASQFGVKVDGIDDGTGDIAAVADYTDFFMRYVAGDTSGVTSPYGDEVYNTTSDPISNGRANLTFGASTSNDTPAGNYSANFSLIATGKF